MPPLAVYYFPKFNPVIVHLGPLALRWYGLAYLLGFVFAYLLLQRLAKRGRLRVKPELVGDFVTWMAFGVFLGGRTWWWLFYHRAQGPEPWYEPFAIWTGGMSFHGGLIGVLAAMFLWTRKNHVSMANLADCSALVTPIGLFFGRIANFINNELVGRPTHVSWGVIFPKPGTFYPDFVYESFARHPSQLYEAMLEGPVLMAALWLLLLRPRPRDGGTALAFVLLYSLIRFCVEFTRQPDVQLGYIAFNWLTMGQIQSIAMALVGLVVWVIYLRRHRAQPVADKPAPAQAPPAQNKRPRQKRP